MIEYMHIHCKSEKLDHLLFEHNFGKYCPMLIKWK